MTNLNDIVEVELGNAACAACAVVSAALAEAKRAGGLSETAVLAILTDALAMGLVFMAGPGARPEWLADAALLTGPVLSERALVLAPLVALLATPHVGEA